MRTRKIQHRELQARVGLAAEELAGTGAADEFSGVDNGAATGKDGSRCALGVDSFKPGIVDAHVMRFYANCFFVIGIEDDQVGVRAHCDRAFARI